MSRKVSRLVFLSIALGVALTSSLWMHGTLPATNVAAATPAVNPYHGTYEGGFWGTVNLQTVAPFGGPIKATVNNDGKVTLTIPGVGVGTVNSAGTFSATGTVKIGNLTVNIAFTGKAIPTKNPANGEILAVDASGTWKVTTVGITASGNWLVRRTKVTF